MLRYLRIAASFVALATCVGLVALWTRGPWQRRVVERMGPLPGVLAVGSTGELLGFSVEPRFFSSAQFMEIEPHPYFHDKPLSTRLGFYFWKDAYSYGFFAPFWMLTLLSLAMSATPWFRWRFRV